MIYLKEGNINLQDKRLLIAGRIAHKPHGTEDEWKPYEGQFDIGSLSELYSVLGLLLLGKKIEGNGDKPLWRLYPGKSMVGLYQPRGEEVRKRFLVFLLATSREVKQRTRFPLNDLTVRALMHKIELSILIGEHSCVINGRDRHLAILRTPETLTFITSNSHAEVDSYGRSLLLHSVERVIERGEARPFKYESIECYNGKQRTIPTLVVKGDGFPLDTASALKLKLLCQ
jgi:hypothetical protein